MKSILGCTVALWLFLLNTADAQVAPDAQAVDVVWLKDGSRLTGTIVRWELERGMELKLVTGANVVISKRDIRRVFQNLSYTAAQENLQQELMRTPKPYAFREQGLYQAVSGYVNTSFLGGAGMDYSIGYRFRRELGVGMGFGFESNDLTSFRNFIPWFAEARGYLLPKKITPYYAVKIGYGFALKNEHAFNETPHGGFYFAPELGVRFGSGPVSFFAGAEYKIQNVTYTTDWGPDYRFEDKVNYRRVEFRTGIVF